MALRNNNSDDEARNKNCTNADHTDKGLASQTILAVLCKESYAIDEQPWHSHVPGQSISCWLLATLGAEFDHEA